MKHYISAKVNTSKWVISAWGWFTDRVWAICCLWEGKNMNMLETFCGVFRLHGWPLALPPQQLSGSAALWLISSGRACCHNRIIPRSVSTNIKTDWLETPTRERRTLNLQRLSPLSNEGSAVKKYSMSLKCGGVDVLVVHVPQKLVRFWAPPYVDNIFQLMHMCIVAEIEYLIASFSSLLCKHYRNNTQSPYIHSVITRWKQS